MKAFTVKAFTPFTYPRKKTGTPVGYTLVKKWNEYDPQPIR
jgi:hypothetical protein